MSPGLITLAEMAVVAVLLWRNPKMRKHTRDIALVVAGVFIAATPIGSPVKTTVADSWHYVSQHVGRNLGESQRPMRHAAMWDRIAACESSGNWSINTGNGYYGGLQFDNQTWLGAGGGRYASRADLASKAQQIAIANKVYADRGLQPWQCGWAA